LGVRRIGLVTPYEQEIETRIIGNYKAAGIDVVANERLDITVNTDYASVPPTQIFEMSKAVAQPGAEAIVILCTNLAGAAIVNAASEATGLPVLDSVEETFRPIVDLASEASAV
jgi:maleate isomerase